MCPAAATGEREGRAATELQYHHNQQCTFGLGYEFKLRQATFEAGAERPTCSATLEERIQPGVSMLFSGMLNHKKKDYKFGFGLIVGGQ